MNIYDALSLMLTELGYIFYVYSQKTYIKGHVINKNKVTKMVTKSLKPRPIDVKIKYNAEVENFIRTIKEKLPYVDLTFMNNNLEDFLIVEKNKLKAINNGGSYDIIKNIIEILIDDKSKSINHELLHLSSTYNNGKTIYAGFSQYQNNRLLIGRGLNEGYTAYLDSKLFGREDGYSIVKPYVMFIEKIVGEENMAKYYFTADLNSLINHLSKYCDETMVYKLINNMDTLLYLIYYKKSSVDYYPKEDVEIIEKIINENAKIVTKMFINLVVDKVETENLKDEIKAFLNIFMWSISDKNLNKSYINMNLFESEIEKYLNEIKKTKEGQAQHKI